MDAAQQLLPVVGVQAAVEALGVSRASLYRWLQPAELAAERRSLSAAAEPARRHPRALSEAECQGVLAQLHAERFADVAPAEVYAILLDEGVYLASERTMYRLLAAEDESHERRHQRTHPAYTKPELLATAPNQVWSWDITKLHGPTKWTYFYLYVILDVYSRYAVGWMVAY